MMSEGTNPQGNASSDTSLLTLNYDGVRTSQNQTIQAGKNSMMQPTQAFNGPSLNGLPQNQYPQMYPGKPPSAQMAGPPVFMQNASTYAPGQVNQGPYAAPAQSFANGPLSGVHTPPKSVSPRPAFTPDRPGSAPGYNPPLHPPGVSATPPPPGHTLMPPMHQRSTSQPSLSTPGSQLQNHTNPMQTLAPTNQDHLRASPRPYTPPSQGSTPGSTPVSQPFQQPFPPMQQQFTQNQTTPPTSTPVSQPFQQPFPPTQQQFTQKQTTPTSMQQMPQVQQQTGPPVQPSSRPMGYPGMGQGMGTMQQPGLGSPVTSTGTMPGMRPPLGPPTQPGLPTSSQPGPPTMPTMPPTSNTQPGSMSALSSSKPKRPVMPSQPSGYMLGAGMSPQPQPATGLPQGGRYPQQPTPPTSTPTQPVAAPPLTGNTNFQTQDHVGRLSGRRQYPTEQYPSSMPGSNPMSQPMTNSMPGVGPQQPNMYGSTKLDGPMSRMSVQTGSQPLNLMEHRNILSTSTTELPLPPLTNMELQKRNVDPDIICCSLNAVPETQSLLNKCKLPFGINLHPFKDLSNLSVIHSTVITRCRACRTYINPFVSFTDSRRWKCNMCFRTNDLPEEFSFDPVSRSYGDPTKRPEIKNATVEFIAPSEYMLRPPQPAVFVFALDVSFNALETGYLHIACNVLKDNLDRLPGDARTMIGFITFNSTIHFYSLKSKLSQPQMFIVSDLDDVFLPAPDDLLVNLKENKEMIMQLLDSLPEMFNGSSDIHCATGAAMTAGLKLTGAIGGRVTVFQTCLPSIGPGALHKREEGGQKEDSKDVANLNPATDYYKKLALDCAAEQVAIDLFLMAGQYSDIATLMCASKYSGGSVSYYPGFHAVRNPAMTEKFESELERYLTRKIGFEAVMRVRCTKGLSIHTFHGNFFVRSTDLLALPNVNPDAAYSMQISIEDSLSDINLACFQSALLYTTSKGERRIRVHTLALPVTNKVNEIYSFANTRAIAVLLSKMAVDRTLMSSIGDAREALLNCLIDSLSAYRSSVSSVQPIPGQLIVPYSLRLLPLYILALLKHRAFILESSVGIDERCYAMQQMKVQPMNLAMLYIYPALYSIPLSEEDVKSTTFVEDVPQPPVLQLSGEKLSRKGVFLMDCGQYIYVWVGKDVPEETCMLLFNVPSFHSIPEGMTNLPELENTLSEGVNRFISYLQSLRQCHSPVYVLREDSRLRTWFLNNLVDDRSQSVMSYYEFMVHVQKQIGK